MTNLVSLAFLSRALRSRDVPFSLASCFVNKKRCVGLRTKPFIQPKVSVLGGDAPSVQEAVEPLSSTWPPKCSRRLLGAGTPLTCHIGCDQRLPLRLSGDTWLASFNINELFDLFVWLLAYFAADVTGTPPHCSHGLLSAHGLRYDVHPCLIHPCPGVRRMLWHVDSFKAAVIRNRVYIGGVEAQFFFFLERSLLTGLHRRCGWPKLSGATRP